ncbi:MAG: SpoIIE family protein phosphatase, partial [Bacteroidota bacterium]
MSSGLINSPYLVWALSLPLYAILLPIKRSTTLIVGGLSLTLTIILVLLTPEKSGFFGLHSPEADWTFHQASALTFVLLNAILIFFKESENASNYSLTRRSNDKLIKDNKILKRQVRDLSHRNHRLIMLYDNLKKFELANEQKTEILTEAARILDTKNKQIQSVTDEYKGQSSQIVELHEDLTNSIRYAQKIQEAITPDPEEVINHFRDAFILYKPKDIVSGDFYWFQEKKMVEGRVKILIAADCTGHGVPGAFMTVIGHSLINEIVNEMHIIQPDILLSELDRKLIEMLSNRKGQTEIHDGMDMVALVIDDYNGIVQYAAAHNPLYYVRNQELIRVKGSRYPVGSSQYRTKKVFDLHTIDTQPGDVFYIFTDGFQDQFGQKEERKYMTRRFRGLLQSVNRLPLGK